MWSSATPGPTTSQRTRGRPSTRCRTCRWRRTSPGRAIVQGQLYSDRRHESHDVRRSERRVEVRRCDEHLVGGAGVDRSALVHGERRGRQHGDRGGWPPRCVDLARQRGEARAATSASAATTATATSATAATAATTATATSATAATAASATTASTASATASATTATSGPTAGPLSRAERARPAAGNGQGADPGAALPSRHDPQGSLPARRPCPRPEPTGRRGPARSTSGSTCESAAANHRTRHSNREGRHSAPLSPFSSYPQWAMAVSRCSRWGTHANLALR